MKKIEWTKKQCKELALKYDRRIRFKTNHSSAYRHNSAVIKGLLDQLFVNHKNKGLVKI